MFDSKVTPINKNTEVPYEASVISITCQQSASCDISLSGTFTSLPQSSVLESIELLLSYFESLPVLSAAKLNKRALSLVTDGPIEGKEAILQLNYSSVKGYTFYIDMPEGVYKNDAVIAIYNKLLDLEDESRGQASTDNLVLTNSVQQYSSATVY